MKSLQALFELQAFFSGSMIALRIPPEQWYRMRSSVVDPLDSPHVTIVYMPNLMKEEIPEVRKAIKKAVQDQDSFVIKTKSKVTTFPGAENSEGNIPHVVRLEKKDITKLRNKLVTELDKIRPDLVDKKFPVYKPHTTLQWVPKETPFPEIPQDIEWNVSEVLLYFKNDHKERFQFRVVPVPDLAEEVLK